MTDEAEGKRHFLKCIKKNNFTLTNQNEFGVKHLKRKGAAIRQICEKRQ